jgi:hypothetical protein
MSSPFLLIGKPCSKDTSRKGFTDDEKQGVIDRLQKEAVCRGGTFSCLFRKAPSEI